MHAYVKPYIDKIEAFAKAKNEKIELLLIGGLAMSIYGIPRHTVDIGAEVKCSEKTYFELIEYLRQENISFNIGDNISNWGIIPLPANYRERAKTVYKSSHLVLKVLDHVDFVFSKLMRGTEEDFCDPIDVIKLSKITKEQLFDRKLLIQFPKDTETFFFEKKFQHLIELII